MGNKFTNSMAVTFEEGFTALFGQTSLDTKEADWDVSQSAWEDKEDKEEEEKDDD